MGTIMTTITTILPSLLTKGKSKSRVQVKGKSLGFGEDRAWGLGIPLGKTLDHFFPLSCGFPQGRHAS